jgi:hypothetical protein
MQRKTRVLFTAYIDETSGPAYAGGGVMSRGEATDARHYQVDRETGGEYEQAVREFERTLARLVPAPGCAWHDVHRSVE